MPESIPERLSWALETLAVEPSDRLLEIGCGNGAAVSLIGGRLTDGTITGIDRSDKMIDTAMKRNAEHVASGKASFLAASLHEADLGQKRFDKIFAVNVNLFWMKAVRELEIVKERLSPGGAVYLFNQPPAAGKVATIVERTCLNLRDAGLHVAAVLYGDQMQIPVACVIATYQSSDQASRGEVPTNDIPS
ncbi:class I SAM-dependent methyltransferase [Paenibacillaceae bacterium WGS1546]|uniref:class I SAM-dependent methyltransferase n=1 Tax=Cohnella sp. WGS1546 TaxID=3366810 RepID=UPI00372D6E28